MSTLANPQPEKLQAASAEDAVMSRRDKLEYLTKAILTPANQIDGSSPLCQRVKSNGEVCMVDKLRALELLARLQREFAADKPDDKPTVSMKEIADAVRRSPVFDRYASLYFQPPAIPANGE